MSDLSAHDLQQRIISWCATRPDILTVIVIGSHARHASPSDAYSDLDLILFCTNPNRYQEDIGWLRAIGDPWITSLNFVARRDPEWMVLFAPGTKADFLFVATSPDQSLTAMLESLPYRHVLTRGYRPIYTAETLSQDSGPVGIGRGDYKLPSEAEFRQKVDSVLFSAERFAKFFRRKDNWRGQFTLHCELKNHLLTLIEWHARATLDIDRDTWYEGREMDSWADKRVISAMRRLNPGLAMLEQRATLLTVLDLTEMLADETASQLDYPYPTVGQRKALAWLRNKIADISS